MDPLVLCWRRREFKTERRVKVRDNLPFYYLCCLSRKRVTGWQQVAVGKNDTSANEAEGTERRKRK